MDSEGQTQLVQFAQWAVSLAEPSHQPIFLRQALSLAWNLWRRLEQLTSKLQGSTCLRLPSSGITNVVYHTQLFFFFLKQLGFLQGKPFTDWAISLASPNILKWEIEVSRARSRPSETQPAMYWLWFVEGKSMLSVSIQSVKVDTVEWCLAKCSKMLRSRKGSLLLRHPSGAFLLGLYCWALLHANVCI